MSSTAHLPEGELRAFLDDELPPSERSQVTRHLAECSACPEQLKALEHASDAAAGLLDLLAPPPMALDVRATIRLSRPAWFRRPGVIAAAATLFIVAVAGATVGRLFVRALVDRVRTVVTGPAAHPEPSATAQAGVGFLPGVAAEITFDAPQDRGELRLSLADTAEIAIRASAPVSYRVRAGGVALHNQGSAASYDVVIPRTAPHVRVLVGGRVVFEKRGSFITTAVSPDPAGRFIIAVR
jgi:anti-sigma factor RsiW